MSSRAIGDSDLRARSATHATADHYRHQSPTTPPWPLNCRSPGPMTHTDHASVAWAASRRAGAGGASRHTGSRKDHPVCDHRAGNPFEPGPAGVARPTCGRRRTRPSDLDLGSAEPTSTKMTARRRASAATQSGGSGCDRDRAVERECPSGRSHNDRGPRGGSRHARPTTTNAAFWLLAARSHVVRDPPPIETCASGYASV